MAELFWPILGSGKRKSFSACPACPVKCAAYLTGVGRAYRTEVKCLPCETRSRFLRGGAYLTGETSEDSSDPEHSRRGAGERILTVDS